MPRNPEDTPVVMLQGGIPSFSVTIGEFTITAYSYRYSGPKGEDVYRLNKIWMKHEEGEGMETTLEKLNEALKDFWAKEF